jgi:methyl-accepting chemotaxis protein-1 (serine sensor receptor)
MSAQQISAAVRQHSIGMEQIVAAMGDISRVTNQNLKATSSTQQAAEELTNLAKRLAAVIAGYRMANGPQIVGGATPGGPDPRILPFDPSRPLAA